MGGDDIREVDVNRLYQKELYMQALEEISG